MEIIFWKFQELELRRISACPCSNSFHYSVALAVNPKLVKDKYNLRNMGHTESITYFPNFKHRSVIFSGLHKSSTSGIARFSWCGSRGNASRELLSVGQVISCAGRWHDIASCHQTNLRQIICCFSRLLSVVYTESYFSCFSCNETWSQKQFSIL